MWRCLVCGHYVAANWTEALAHYDKTGHYQFRQEDA